MVFDKMKEELKLFINYEGNISLVFDICFMLIVIDAYNW